METTIIQVCRPNESKPGQIQINILSNDEGAMSPLSELCARGIAKFLTVPNLSLTEGTIAGMMPDQTAVQATDLPDKERYYFDFINGRIITNAQEMMAEKNNFYHQVEEITGGLKPAFDKEKRLCYVENKDAAKLIIANSNYRYMAEI